MGNTARDAAVGGSALTSRTNSNQKHSSTAKHWWLHDVTQQQDI
jgi:hypothetical protein